VLLSLIIFLYLTLMIYLTSLVRLATLDLASGFWQIHVHDDSQEKTPFSTPFGLFEFRVMPFGLKNAPSVFQQLMQQVMPGINPESGPSFVAAYIDNLLIFSVSLQEYLDHLCKVIHRLREVGLKVNPGKCQFIRREVEYLGHTITPEGLKPNSKLRQSETILHLRLCSS